MEDGPLRATEAESAFVSSGLPERRIPAITLMPRVPSSARGRPGHALRPTRAVIRSLPVSKLEFFQSFETGKAICIRMRRGANPGRAMEMRASRIRCSLMVRTVCPECGAVGVKINRQTGFCPRCTERYHLEQERAFRDQLERERREAEEGAEIERLHRERKAIRQQSSRTCRKYGLPSRRQRGKD